MCTINGMAFRTPLCNNSVFSFYATQHLSLVRKFNIRIFFILTVRTPFLSELYRVFRKKLCNEIYEQPSQLSQTQGT